jgi:succinyl-diaminopimelate desuccinylase
VDPLALRTLELVDIPSESREEAAVVDHVRGVMPGLPVYDDDTVLFYPGRIVLAGHYDTVPSQGNLPGRIEDGWVVGLGSTDMKGGVAVMIELARAGAPFGYLFFGREELPAGESALPRFFERHGLDADLVVMLEPTDDSIHAGCLGNIDARLVFHGVSAHSARPWMGDNAIDHAVRGLASIVELQPIDVEIQGLVFREVLSVTGIEGGIASNVIPDRAVATLNFRYAPNRTAEEGAARLRELVGSAGELALLGNSPPAHVAVETPLVQELRAAGNFEIHPKQAWTPVAEFAQQGLDAVNLGPGATRYAHKRDERVEIAALRRTHDALLRFIDTVNR